MRYGIVVSSPPVFSLTASLTPWDDFGPRNTAAHGHRQAPRRGSSVVDGPSRLGLEHAGEVVGHELLVASEVEAVASRNRGGDTAERRGERSHHHRLGHFPVTGMLGGHLDERLGQEGSSTEVRGSDRYGR